MTEVGFWAKVTKTDRCWLWTGAKDRYGHGRVRWQGRIRPAHVVAWEILRGKMPVGTEGCHECDNPSCVRPDPEHVQPGTHAENMRHAAKLGRMRRSSCGVRGENHHNAKLTQSDVDTIRTSGEPYSVLAEQFGVGKATIYRIKNNLAWRKAG